VTAPEVICLSAPPELVAQRITEARRRSQQERHAEARDTPRVLKT
jgi:hypothetical protein